MGKDIRIGLSSGRKLFTEKNNGILKPARDHSAQNLK